MVSNLFEQKMETKNNLLFIAFVLVLILGCFMQILSICELFFSYPTVILSETNFDVFETPLPTMTFCAYVLKRNKGLTSEKIFETFNVSEIVEGIHHWNVEKGYELNIAYQVQFTPSLSKDCRWFTINPNKHGKLIFN